MDTILEYIVFTAALITLAGLWSGRFDLPMTRKLVGSLVAGSVALAPAIVVSCLSAVSAAAWTLFGVSV